MKKNFVKTLFLILILSTSLVLVVCNGNETSSDSSSLIATLKNAKIPQLQYQIINTYPHNRRNFTEGLFLNNNYLYESTGLYGKSTLQKIEMPSGKIIKNYLLPSNYFGEGITLIGNQIFQLTYREHTGFVYDKNSFALQKQFNYANEGWGLTSDNKQLIMSNGSSTLTFIDPKTLKPTHTLNVTVQNKKIRNINELEYINGKIYANVWPSSIILIISAESGKVEGWMDIGALKPTIGCGPDCVANGITHNGQDHTLMVTGKNWPSLYVIKVQ